MSADTDGWEVVSKDPFAVNGSPPELTIYVDGSGRLNATADRALDLPEAVQFLAKPEEELLGISPTTDANELDIFSVTRSSRSAGGDVRPTQALERIGVDVDAIDETQKVRLEKEGELLVADCSDLITAATHTDEDLDGTTAADDDTDDEPEEYACTHDGCEFTSESERGKNIHEARIHDGEEDTDDSDDHDEADTSDQDGPSEEMVRDCADSVDTVQELAGLLEVSEGRARLLAREHDVADQLDDDVTPMGVGVSSR